MKKIYLIDGTALIYRSFYALPQLKTSDGIVTNAIYGFTSTLIKIMSRLLYFWLHVTKLSY